MSTLHLRPTLAALALVLGPFALTACDSIAHNETLAGRYVASRLTLIADGDSVDVLDAGGSLEMTLRTDWTVSGRLNVPAELAEGETTFDLAGTYDVAEEGLEFDQTADTFIRDVAWGFDAAAISVETPRLSVRLDRE